MTTNNTNDEDKMYVVSPYELFGKKGVKEDDIYSAFIEYNQELACRSCCSNVFNPTTLSCNCLSIFLEAPGKYCEAVAEYQLVFGRLKSEEQKKVLIEWMRNMPIEDRTRHDKRYRIPFILHESDSMADYNILQEATVCQSSLARLLGRGRKWWYACRKHAMANTFPKHALKGREPNNKRKWNQDFDEDLAEHFESLRKEAEPFATSFVREKTGETTLRDANEKLEMLPPSLSKRSCYARFCLERGWKIFQTNKGNIKKEAVEGRTQQTTPSLASYCAFWLKRYPNLKVRKPTEDICGYCYKIYNRAKYRSSDDSNNAATPSPSTDAIEFDTTDQEGRELSTGNEQSIIDTVSNLTDNHATGITAPDTETIQWESILVEASKHVSRARAQRSLVNRKIEEARQHQIDNKVHEERTHTLIADYAQNLMLPHFGSTQPGETYYYTPLTLYLFGVVDTSDNDKCYTHIFREGDGRKGGNSVASLLLKTLKKLSIMKEDENGSPITGHELNVVFDNCPGQNKNNWVLWLVPYLVELKYFKRVNFIFLIVGHTKNACDRRFNNVKKQYHKSNVYTFDMCVELCNQSEHVDIWKVEDGDFLNYKDFFLPLYKKLASVKVKITENQIFSCCMEDLTDPNKVFITVRASDLPEDMPTRKNVIKLSPNSNPAVRYNILKTTMPAPIPFEGVPSFKQVQLYENFRPLIPAIYQDITCPKPPDHILKAEGADQKRRKEAKLYKLKLEEDAKMKDETQGEI